MSSARRGYEYEGYITSNAEEVMMPCRCRHLYVFKNCVLDKLHIYHTVLSSQFGSENDPERFPKYVPIELVIKSQLSTAIRKKGNSHIYHRVEQ